MHSHTRPFITAIHPSITNPECKTDTSHDPFMKLAPSEYTLRLDELSE